jgi:hypothetical protein
MNTKCDIRVKDFPFDTQCCEINFYSWAHTAKQMSIKQVDNKNTTNTTYLRFVLKKLSHKSFVFQKGSLITTFFIQLYTQYTIPATADVSNSARIR